MEASGKVNVLGNQQSLLELITVKRVVHHLVATTEMIHILVIRFYNYIKY